MEDSNGKKNQKNNIENHSINKVNAINELQNMEKDNIKQQPFRNFKKQTLGEKIQAHGLTFLDMLMFFNVSLATFISTMITMFMLKGGQSNYVTIGV